MIRKALLTLMGATGLVTVAHAQYYGSFDVNVYNHDYGPSVGEAMMFDSIMRQGQYIAQLTVLQFQKNWLYQKPKSEKAIEIQFVPGLGAAIKNGDWGAATQFFYTAQAQERAYEKYYHRPSPAFVAAIHQAGYKMTTKDGKTY